MAVLTTVRTWGRLVKFSHSVFALPFALVGAALAAVGHPVTVAQVGWIVIAMVGARNAAMGFNRLADHALDADNPRTAARELPAGRLSRAKALLAGRLSRRGLAVPAVAITLPAAITPYSGTVSVAPLKIFNSSGTVTIFGSFMMMLE